MKGDFRAAFSFSDCDMATPHPHFQWLTHPLKAALGLGVSGPLTLHPLGLGKEEEGKHLPPPAGPARNRVLEN